MGRKADKAERISHEIKKGIYKDFIKAMKELEDVERRKSRQAH